MGVLPNMFPGYQDVTDPAVRQKFADARGIDVTVMDDRVGTRITEVPHLARKVKSKPITSWGRSAADRGRPGSGAQRL